MRVNKAEVTAAVAQRTLRIVEACDALTDALNDRIDALSSMLVHVGVTEPMQYRCITSPDPVAELQLIGEEIKNGTYKDQ